MPTLRCSALAENDYAARETPRFGAKRIPARQLTKRQQPLELVNLKAVLDEIPSTPQEIIQWLRHEAKEVLREGLGLSSGDVSEMIMLRKQDLKTLISEGSGAPADFMKLEASLELLDAAAAKTDKQRC